MKKGVIKNKNQQVCVHQIIIDYCMDRLGTSHYVAEQQRDTETQTLLLLVFSSVPEVK